MACMFLLFLVLHISAALDNGVGLHPPMGYNTWNDLGCSKMTEANVKAVADAMAGSGLQAAGYNYINLDDCWHAQERNTVTKRLEGDPVRFPSGMKALGDFLHSKGFKFGIYTDRGSKTCAGRPGSLNYEELDAQTFADWGVDYVKEDNCFASTGTNDKDVLFSQFGAFRDALNKTGRPIFFSVCGGGGQMPWNDIRYYATDPRGGKALSNSWRITPDVVGMFTLQDGALTDDVLADFSGPGGFNDPDMLLGSTRGAARMLTERWSRTQFNVWAIVMAPLLIGAPVGKINNFDLETYSNSEVIAVNQDRLLKQGRRVESWGFPLMPGSFAVWARNLSNGDAAIVFVNSGWIDGNITCSRTCWSRLPFNFGSKVNVRDLWAHSNAEIPIAVSGRDFSVPVNAWGSSRMFRLSIHDRAGVIANKTSIGSNGSPAPAVFV